MKCERCGMLIDATDYLDDLADGIDEDMLRPLRPVLRRQGDRSFDRFLELLRGGKVH
jgi:hypothetical protein